MTEIRKVAVLGTGVLGSQIAFQSAYTGFEVVAYDINDESLQKALSIGVQKGPPIGVQKGPPSSSSVTGMTGALFALVAA